MQGSKNAIPFLLALLAMGLSQTSPAVAEETVPLIGPSSAVA